MLGTNAKYVYTVYRLKSFSLAAQELFISQPSLSRAVKKAEEVLGAPIFNRKTLPISLTAEGKIYIEALEKMLQIEQNAAKQVNESKHIQFHNIQSEPFTIYGIFYENGRFRRLPESVAKNVSKGVYGLHTNTAGGRVRFTTTSSTVAIKAIMPEIERMPHFTLTGTAGFDMYIGKDAVYYASFVPPYNMSNGYESIIHFEDCSEKEITIHFPLYSDVSEVYIGLDENAVLKKAPEYKYSKPIVFYGSSITQGGCATRPGNSYENVISRTLHTDYINLGFSGNALAEDEIAQYIKDLDMSVFVFDYDHNAPTLKHLEDTHQKMFTTIRNAKPELPIILLARPRYLLNSEDKQRLAIIKKTYNEAVAAGDKNVYIIDGPTLMQYAKNDGTVDGDHPNDLGFHSMAQALIPQLQALL